MKSQFEDRRAEIATHQDYAIRVAMYTFGIIALVVGVCADRSARASDLILLGRITGPLLAAALIYENAVARKIFWIAAFLQEMDPEDANTMWEQSWGVFRRRYRWKVGYWVETRALAYCLIILCGVMTFVFWGDALSTAFHVLACLLALWLLRVPSIDYRAMWQQVLREPGSDRSQPSPSP